MKTWADWLANGEGVDARRRRRMKNRGEKPVFLRPRAPAFWAYK
jgi:hypothetical protein